MQSSLTNMWRRRHLLRMLVSSNLKRQNKNSVLGYLWWWLDPILMTAIYYLLVVVLFRRRSTDVPYLLYLVSGLLPWKAFADSLSQSVLLLRSQAAIIRSIGFPKAVLPISMVLSNTVYMLFAMVIVVGLALLYGPEWNTWPNVHYLWLPLVILEQVLFTVGLALLVSLLGVLFQDTANILNHLLRMWMYLSPILYTLGMVPPSLRHIFMLNPIAAYFGAYHDILIQGRFPGAWHLGYGALAALLSVLLGLGLFRRLEGKVVQRL